MSRKIEKESNRIPGLTLTRDEGQAVIIDGKIRVLVRKISGSRVKLTFQNAEDVVIDREEVHLGKVSGNHA